MDLSLYIQTRSKNVDYRWLELPWLAGHPGAMWKEAEEAQLLSYDSPTLFFKNLNNELFLVLTYLPIDGRVDRVNTTIRFNLAIKVTFKSDFKNYIPKLCQIWLENKKLLANFVSDFFPESYINEILENKSANLVNSEKGCQEFIEGLKNLCQNTDTSFSEYENKNPSLIGGIDNKLNKDFFLTRIKKMTNNQIIGYAIYSHIGSLEDFENLKIKKNETLTVLIRGNNPLNELKNKREKFNIKSNPLKHEPTTNNTGNKNSSASKYAIVATIIMVLMVTSFMEVQISQYDKKIKDLRVQIDNKDAEIATNTAKISYLNNVIGKYDEMRKVLKGGIASITRVITAKEKLSAGKSGNSVKSNNNDEVFSLLEFLDGHETINMNNENGNKQGNIKKIITIKFDAKKSDEAKIQEIFNTLKSKKLTKKYQDSKKTYDSCWENNKEELNKAIIVLNGVIKELNNLTEVDSNEKSTVQ